MAARTVVYAKVRAMPYGPKPRPAEDRFLEKVDATGDCWLWQGTKNNLGYGMFMRVSPHKELAHRASYVMFVGAIPTGQNVLHSCDNPACVRPEHLRLGSMADNTRDMMSKGRGRFEVHKGVANGNALLNDDLVREMRKAYSAGDVSQKMLAQRYGISRALVSFVVTRKAWKHVA